MFENPCICQYKCILHVPHLTPMVGSLPVFTLMFICCQIWGLAMGVRFVVGGKSAHSQYSYTLHLLNTVLAYMHTIEPLGLWFIILLVQGQDI